MGNNNEQQEAAKKANNIADTLASKSGRGLKVDKSQAVVGDNTQYKITNQAGAETEVTINNVTSNVDVRGEQKELKGAVESGNLNNTNNAGDKASDIKQQAIDIINSSNLSEKEKSSQIAEISSKDFSKDSPGSNQEYLQTVRAKLKEKEEKSQEPKEPNAMEKAFDEVIGGKGLAPVATAAATAAAIANKIAKTH